jgi:mRNA interferase MazF
MRSCGVALMAIPRRGDIVRLRLDPVLGSEQAAERPVLVVSPNAISDHSPVILVAPFTNRKTERVSPATGLLG